MKHIQNSNHRLAGYSPPLEEGGKHSPLPPNKFLISAFLAVILTACGSPDEELSYPVPDNICGVPVEKEVLKSLLHDGDKLEQDNGNETLAEGQFCHIYVDGNDSVVSDANWHESGYSLRDYFLDYKVKGLRYLKGEKFASWESGVATVISCPGISDDGDALSVEVTDIRHDEKSQELLEKLVPSYFDAYKEKLGCQS